MDGFGLIAFFLALFGAVSSPPEKVEEVEQDVAWTSEESYEVLSLAYFPTRDLTILLSKKRMS